MASLSTRGKAIARAPSPKSLARGQYAIVARSDATRIRNLIDKTPAAIFIFQGNRNRLVNPAAEALTGYSRKELLKMDFWEFIHPDFRDMVRQRGLARQRSVHIPPRYELKIIRKDGAERWLDYSGAAIRLRGKTAIIGTAIDITEKKLVEERLRRNLSHLRALHETSLAAMSTLDLNTVLEALLDKFDQFLPCPAVSVISVANAQTRAPEVKALRNISEREWARFIPQGGQGLSKAVLESKSPVMVADALKDPRIRYPEFFRENGLVSYLGLPLIVGDRVLGDICFFTKEKHRFSNEEIELLASLANQAGVAIHNSQLYDEMRRRSNELAALNALTVATGRSLDLNSVLQEAAKGIVELFCFDGARIYLFDEVMEEAHLKSSFETEPGPWTRVKAVRAADGIVGRVAQTAEPVIFEDIRTDPRYDQLSQTGGVKNAGARFMAVFPIQSKLRSWGSLSCIAKQPRRLNVDEIDLLIAMCNQIGIAIENASLYQNTAAKAKELSALYAVAGISAQFVDMNALVYQSMAKICDIFGFTAARIYVFDKGTNENRLVAHEGFPPVFTPPRSYKKGEGLVGRVMDSGLPLAFEDMQNDPEYQRLAQARTMLNAGFRASFFIPLRVRGETLGVMNFVGKEPHSFSPADLNLINSIAYHLGIAVGNANLFAQLRQKTLDLEKANNAKNEFLSIISHELRTPLNLIMGYTDLMKQGAFGNLAPGLESAVLKVGGQTKELLSMIEGILVTTTIEAGVLELTRTEFTVGELFDQLRSFYALPLGKDVHLRWDIPTDLIPIKTDADKLKRILRNLVDNAIKFTAEGSVSVSARHLPEAKRVVFGVSDTGIGIAKDDSSVIFEIFRQLDSTATRSHGGVGLGLYIVKHLTKILGGEVAVESEPGKGSTFTVTIPSGT